MNLHTSFSTVAAHSVFLTDDQTLVSCGLNDVFQLGHEHRWPTGGNDSYTLHSLTRLLKNEDIVSVALGVFSTMLLTRSGRVFLFGRVYGASPETGEVIFNEKVTSIGSGWDYWLAVTESGVLYSWGDPKEGQEATGRLSDLAIPSRVDIPGTVISVSAASSHVVALTQEGEVYGWGWSYAFRSLPGITKQTNFLQPVKLNLGVEVDHTTSGSGHTYVIDKKGVVYGFGYSQNGELGIFKKSSPLTEISLPKKVTLIASGYLQTLALCEDGSLWSWGDETRAEGTGLEELKWKEWKEEKERKEGEEEAGGEKGREEVTGIEGEEDKGEIVSLMCNMECCYVLFSSGKIFGWGLNSAGELGLGHAESVNHPVCLPGKKYSFPVEFSKKKVWEGIIRWIFLGRQDRGSIASKLPVEVLFHCVGILRLT
jgi:alpha-tubulin suppressor-like RCC1 family protein